MSRIGKLPILLPDGVSMTVNGDEVKVKGPKGELSQTLPPMVVLDLEGQTAVVKKTEETRQAGAFQGLARTLVNNMVLGVSQGYERKLELVGVGYRAELQGRNLNLAVGYSNPVIFELPQGVDAEVDRTNITVRSINKELLGLTAAKIRAVRPPEPYKGKGIKYADETIRRKAGKAGAK